MMWQDWVIAASSAAFSIGLIPQVLRGWRDRRGYIEGMTAAVTTVGLCLSATTMLTLHLWLSGSLYILSGTLWCLLWMQRLTYGGPETENRDSPRRVGNPKQAEGLSLFSREVSDGACGDYGGCTVG